MYLDSYKAVFFDVGGTLLKVHPSVGEIYAKYARFYGYQGSEEELNHQFAKAWEEVGGLESLGRKSGSEVERSFWYDIVYRVFESQGGLNDFKNYFEQVYQAFLSADSWRIYDDVLESAVLKKLRSRDVKLGVISNWDSRLERILEATGLAKYFDFILASTVVGSAKPDEKIFEEALSRAGVDRSQACHIGDEPATDIEGANNVGIDAILIDRKKIHNSRFCTVIGSFRELQV